MKRNINEIIRENEILLKQIRENKEKFWKEFGGREKKIVK
jgi:hypothetical protein